MKKHNKLLLIICLMTAILCLTILSGCQNEEYSLAGSGSVTINLQEEYSDVQVDCVNADIQKISSTEYVLEFDSINNTQAVISSSGYQTKYLDITAADISSNRKFDITLDTKHYVVKVKVEGIDTDSQNTVSFDADNTDIIQQENNNGTYELHSLQPLQNLQVNCNGYKSVTFEGITYNNYTSNIKAVLLTNDVTDKVCFVFKNNDVATEGSYNTTSVMYRGYTDTDYQYENVDLKYSHYTMELSSLEDIVVNDVAYSVRELNSKAYHTQTLENTNYNDYSKEIYFENMPSDIMQIIPLSQEILNYNDYIRVPQDLIGQTLYFIVENYSNETFLCKKVLTQEQYNNGLMDFPSEFVDNRTVTVKRQAGSDAIYNYYVGEITEEGVEISLVDLVRGYVQSSHDSDVKYDILYKNNKIVERYSRLYDEVFIADLFNESIDEFVFSTQRREKFVAKVKFMADGNLVNDIEELASYLGDDGYYTFNNVEDGEMLYTYYPYDDTDVLYNSFVVPFNKNVYTYNEEDGAYYYTVNLDLIYTITINITNIDYIKELMGYECNININATFNGNYLNQFNEIDFNDYKGVEFQLSKNEINKVLQLDITIEVGISNRYISYTVRKVTQEDIDAGKIDLELIFIEIG